MDIRLVYSKKLVSILFIIIFILPLLLSSIKSQDTILKITGEKLIGLIRDQDEKNVYLVLKKENYFISTKISRDSIQQINSKQNKQSDLVNFKIKHTVGIGLGLDYGGIGLNFNFYPVRNIGLLAGIGYAFAGIGLNAGMKLRFLSKYSESNSSPFMLIMYGYNAAIHVTDASQFDKLFYGPSFGIGVDYKFKKSKNSYFTGAILLPLRSSEVKDYMRDLSNNYGVVFKNELFPIAISIGFKFSVN